MKVFSINLIAVLSLIALLGPSASYAEKIKEPLVIRVKDERASESAQHQRAAARFEGALKKNLQIRFDIRTTDLKPLIEEQGVSGNTAISAVKYALLITVTEFSDDTSRLSTDTGDVYAFRTVKVAGNVELTTLSGKNVASAQFSATDTEKNRSVASATSVSTTATEDKFGSELLEKVPEMAAMQVFSNVVYWAAPPKVTDVEGKQVTIDCGEGLINRGDKFEVFKLKQKEDEDPVEISVGFVEVSRVMPKTSTALIVGDGNAIAEKCILRKP